MIGEKLVVKKYVRIYEEDDAIIVSYEIVDYVKRIAVKDSLIDIN